MNTHPKYCISLIVIYLLTYLSLMMVSTGISVTSKLKFSTITMHGTKYSNII